MESAVIRLARRDASWLAGTGRRARRALVSLPSAAVGPDLDGRELADLERDCLWSQWR